MTSPIIEASKNSGMKSNAILIHKIIRQIDASNEDRTSKFIYAELHSDKTRDTASRFL
jgi:hypothetical protein